MKKSTKFVAAGVVAASAVAVGAGVVVAQNADDDETPITGDAYDRATEIALELAGGGEVTETEVDDEDSYYEVEITLDDGSEFEVQLDEDFDVVSSGLDDEDDQDDDD